ncbi:hypothetical protein [Shewanella algae]|nr:hypothetical protein [Shewanella algae]QNH99314.1 hypothetical protein HU689_12370 [Shewanella algae]
MKPLEVVKLVAIVSFKFYIKVTSLLMPVLLFVFWPKETPFSLELLFKILGNLLVHPVIYANYGVIFIGFLITTIADKWVRK